MDVILARDAVILALVLAESKTVAGFEARAAGSVEIACRLQIEYAAQGFAMPWIPELTGELNLRSGLALDELADWKARADKDVDGAGLHQSQVGAITVMFDELGK